MIRVSNWRGGGGNQGLLGLTNMQLISSHDRGAVDDWPSVQVAARDHWEGSVQVRLKIVGGDVSKLEPLSFASGLQKGIEEETDYDASASPGHHLPVTPGDWESKYGEEQCPCWYQHERHSPVWQWDSVWSAITTVSSLRRTADGLQVISLHEG